MERGITLTAPLCFISQAFTCCCCYGGETTPAAVWTPRTLTDFTAAYLAVYRHALWNANLISTCHVNGETQAL